MKVNFEKDFSEDDCGIGIGLFYLRWDKSLVLSVAFFKHTFSITIKINSK